MYQYSQDSSWDAIFQYSDNHIEQSTNQEITNAWLDECNIKRITEEVSLYIEFDKRNNVKSNIEFMTQEKYANDCQLNKGMSWIL